MKWAIASDHGGYDLKKQIISYFKDRNIEVVDLGTNNSSESVSYALYGHKLAKYILSHPEFFGIGICGTGLGISYALNRHQGIRAARTTTIEDGRLAKLHNDANVLVFGGRQISIELAKDIIEEFSKTKFEGGRHISRIQDIEIQN